MGSMKIVAVLVISFCTACTAQSPHAPHKASQQAHLRDSFAKMSLRALLAIKSENCNDEQAISATDLLINDADVEAASKIEMQVISNLQTVQALNIINSKLRGLRLEALEASASLRASQTGKVESSLDTYNADPDVIARSKQDQTCQDALESSLRKRTYSPLPAICTTS
jgi:hypothetical protein